jgi:hypothetical protein
MCDVALFFLRRCVRLWCLIFDFGRRFPLSPSAMEFGFHRRGCGSEILWASENRTLSAQMDNQIRILLRHSCTQAVYWSEARQRVARC